ncbi:hypothetical protein BDBG_16910, partial [Blastomyces gilchristii SLH14081]
CSNCQRYEHFAISCFRDSKCAFYARDHKLVSINVKHAQKEVKYVNILCLSASITKKNMHLAQKN